MSEQQLERSVLEGKEREELFAIANALSTRPTSRAKKSDLVTAILRATGVEESGVEPERARRPRARRTPVEAADGGQGEDRSEADADDAAPGRTERSDGDELAERSGPSGPPVVQGRLGVGDPPPAAAAPAPAPAASPTASTPARARAASSTATARGRSAAGSPVRPGGSSRGDQAAELMPVPGTADEDGDRSGAAGISAGAGAAGAHDETVGAGAVGSGAVEAGADRSDVDSGGRDGGETAAEREGAGGTDRSSGGGPDGQPGASPGARTGAGTPGARGGAGSSGAPLTRSPRAGTPPSAEGSGTGTNGSGPQVSQGSPGQLGQSGQVGQSGPSRQSGDIGSGQGQGGQGADGNDGRFDAEPGRRNRRRRGRDRGTERPERELQGQAAEAQYSGDPIPAVGLLDLRDEGYGFLRTSGYLAGPDDVYVSISQVRRFALRKGDHLEGAARPAGNNEKYPALLRIDSISGQTPEEARNRPRFENLTPLFPDHKLALEVPGDPANTTARIVDLISPIGKGQRGLIVSPPKAGKTTILKQIAHSIEANNPDVHLMVLLVDERPEEVTDMRRSVKGEVIASTFDRPSEEHTQVAELAIERAKRMVEQGRDVVVVLDGITRLARAYNLAQPATGRIMSGGIDTGALYPPKKFFGAARNIEEGGSLTILATALVETGSKMDEVIFEEFKGTGNMELRLDRRLAERRVYPAIDVNGSSTRHEELLFDRTQLQQVWKLRRALNALASEGTSAASLELLMDKIRSTRSNDEFLAELAKNPAPAV